MNKTFKIVKRKLKFVICKFFNKKLKKSSKLVKTVKNCRTYKNCQNVDQVIVTHNPDQMSQCHR